MKRIGLLSDTHGFIEQKIINFFSDCDEIWHAGDIGNIETADAFEKIKTFRAVYGNIDNNKLRLIYPEHQRFLCEEVDVWITHIGGYPGRYDKRIFSDMLRNPPKLFISGHSHIAKVINDPKFRLLHINPGAAGNNGIHKVKTAVRFEIDKKNIRNLELIELKR